MLKLIQEICGGRDIHPYTYIHLGKADIFGDATIVGLLGPLSRQRITRNLRHIDYRAAFKCNQNSATMYNKQEQLSAYDFDRNFLIEWLSRPSHSVEYPLLPYYISNNGAEGVGNDIGSFLVK